MTVGSQTILAIETVIGDGSVSLWISGEEVAHVIGGSTPPLSETLLDITSQMLADNRIAVETIDLVAVSLGPGSYTGIRVGVSSALGFAYSIGSKLVGVSTLRALAELAKEVEGDVCVAIDAGREEVISQQFEVRDGVIAPRSGPELVGTRDLVRDTLRRKTIVDLNTYQSLQGSFPDQDLSNLIVASDNVAGLLVGAVESNGTESDLTPIYTREFAIKTV